MAGITGAKSGDYAWGAIIVAAIAYELCADDLLSDSTRRWCVRHPLLTRLLIAELAGHLACVLPASIDVFNAKNVVHRWAVYHYPLARHRQGEAAA